MLLKQVMDRFGNRSRWIAAISLVTIVAAVCVAARPVKQHVPAPASRPAEKTSPLNARLSTHAASSEQQAHIATSFENPPLSFEPNRGQTDSQVKFNARADGYQLYLGETKAVLSLTPRVKVTRPAGRPAVPLAAESRGSVVEMNFLGAKDQPEITASDPLPGVSNYFVGNDPNHWATGVPHYARVEYREAYPGINLQFSGQGRELELGFVVAAGADPAAIKFAFSGSNAVHTDPEGELAVVGETGGVRFATLHAYQEVAGRQKSVDASFSVHDGNQVVLALGAYDRSHDLIIEPGSDVANTQFRSAATDPSRLLSLAWIPMIGIVLAGVGAVQRKRLLATLMLCLSVCGLAVLVACGN